jgi:poly(3-hydroxybutyrate) depolymerase
MSLFKAVLLSACLARLASPATHAAPPDAAVAALDAWLRNPAAQRPAIGSQDFAKVPLTKEHARRAADALWKDHVEALRASTRAEWEGREIKAVGRSMKFETVWFGTNQPSPSGGWPLFISMHGGGGAPARVNDSQWRNQVRLAQSYAPKQGLYVAPRAPTDTWNLWHEGHIDPLFARLIESAVVLENVSPDRVYLMGYSAGGDGVYQLAPRMADWFAAAAMSAGHPNETQPFGLRNLPFALQVGGDDSAYNRNRIASDWGGKFQQLREADPGGYASLVKVHEGKPHWMGMADRIAIPWMESHVRNPLPDRVAWRQDDVLHEQFYWLAVPGGSAKAGQEVLAERKGQSFQIIRSEPPVLVLRLNDDLADLDKPIEVAAGQRSLFKGVVPRTIGLLAQTLAARGDRRLMFASEVEVRP